MGVRDQRRLAEEPVTTGSSPAALPAPSRNRLRIAGWVGLFAILTGIVTVALLPSLGEPLARRALTRFAARFSGTVSPGRLTMDTWTTIRLDRLDWQDGNDIKVAARDVRVRLDFWSALFGGPPVRELAVGSLAFRLGDPEHPQPSPGRLLDRLRQATGAGKRQLKAPIDPNRPTRVMPSRRPQRLPLIRLDALSGEIHCQPVDNALIEGGWLEVSIPQDAIASCQRRIEGGLDLMIAGDAPRHLSLSGHMQEDLDARFLSATSTPPIVFPLANGEARLGGISWSGDTISLLNPAWTRPGRIDADAVSVTVRWDPAAVPTDSNWLPEGVPQRLREALNRFPVREVDILRPTVVLRRATDLASSAPTPEPRSASKAVSENADLQARAVARYTAVERSVLAALSATEGLIKRLPKGRLSVQGARLRFEEPNEGADEALNALSQVTFTVVKEDDGKAHAQVHFETPEGRPGDNELQAGYDPTTRTLSLTLRSSALQLFPYRGFMPRGVTPTPDSLLGPADIAMTAVIPDTIQAGGAFTVLDLALVLPAVASTPIHAVDLRLSGSLDWNLRDARLETQDASIGIGRILVPFTANASNLRQAPRLRIEAAMTRMGAQQALESVPADLLPALEGVRLSGTVAASGTFDIDTSNLAGMRLDIVPDVADMTTVSLGKAAGVELLKTHFLHRIERSDKSVISRIVGDVSPEWVSLDAVPGHLIGALTTSEDAEFFRHQGFSREGIRRSLRVNLERGGFYQGASTLSQQLVKNLFLSREKTLARKLQEAFLTWQIEQYLTKEKILELYLNVIEWGPGVWGIGGAARHYFGKAPSELTLLESAYLVSVIPAPSRNHAHWEAGSVPKAFEQRVKRLVREMQRRGLVETSEADEAIEQSLHLASPNREPLAPGGDDDDIPDEEFSD